LKKIGPVWSLHLAKKYCVCVVVKPKVDNVEMKRGREGDRQGRRAGGREGGMQSTGQFTKWVPSWSRDFTELRLDRVTVE
jgi:hypothetical protein